MLIALTSDAHGYLPKISKCHDITILCGDMLPNFSHDPLVDSLAQQEYISAKFIPWLESIPSDLIILVGGNHDRVFEHLGPEATQELFAKVVPKVVYLQDSSYEVDGITIFGSPWVIPCGNWAFQATDQFLTLARAEIPNSVNILAVHCPPYGVLDSAPSFSRAGGTVKIGDYSINAELPRLKQLQLIVTGHAHNQEYNKDVCQNIRCYNVAEVVEYYDYEKD